MVLEIFYVIWFIMMVMALMAAGALVSGLGSSGMSSYNMGSSYSSSYSSSRANYATVKSTGDSLMYVAIGLIVAYIPRLFYLGKLCGYVCCGGKVKDTSDDRQGCVIAMNALLISHIMTAVLAVIITAATGGNFGRLNVI